MQSLPAHRGAFWIKVRDCGHYINMHATQIHDHKADDYDVRIWTTGSTREGSVSVFGSKRGAETRLPRHEHEPESEHELEWEEIMMLMMMILW